MYHVPRLFWQCPSCFRKFPQKMCWRDACDVLGSRPTRRIPRHCQDRRDEMANERRPSRSFHGMARARAAFCVHTLRRGAHSPYHVACVVCCFQSEKKSSNRMRTTFAISRKFALRLQPSMTSVSPRAAKRLLGWLLRPSRRPHQARPAGASLRVR